MIRRCNALSPELFAGSRFPVFMPDLEWQSCHKEEGSVKAVPAVKDPDFLVFHLVRKNASFPFDVTDSGHNSNEPPDCKCGA